MSGMDEIYELFSKTIHDYDTVASSVVFRNDEIHQVQVDSLPFAYKNKLQILDLGSGTGYGMRLIAERFPKAVITGIDFSPLMIEKAKDHLTAHAERIALKLEDFRESVFDTQYDAIVSTIAIHNISNEQKSLLFKKIYEALKPGGVFVNGDFYAGETVTIDNDLRKLYEDYLRQNLKGDELKVWLKHAFTEDMPMKLSEQISLLTAAGFDKVEIKWVYNNEALYVACK